MTTPQQCEDLEVGDITITLLNSDTPSALAMFALRDIDATVGSIFVTDNAWTGNDFTTEEGTLELEIPNSGIAQGTLIGYGAVASPPTRFVNDWKEDGFFDINARGDQILIYCLVNATEPHFLWGFNTLKEWDISGLSDYDTNTSALPAELVDVGNVAFDHCDNLFWEDPTPKVSSSDKTENLAKFQDPLNYRCNDRLPWKYEEVEPNSSAANWGHENMLSLTIFFFLAWVNLRV